MIPINFLAASRIQAAIECLPRTAAEDHSDRYSAGKGEIEMSHTKGPWRWSDAYQARDQSDTYSLLGADGFGILSCDGLCNSPQHLNKADAALIADAPAMLDALESVCMMWHVVCDTNGWHADHMPQYTEARALIAKHRGGK